MTTYTLGIEGGPLDGGAAVEAYNSTYYRPFQTLEEDLRNQLVDGKDHLYESEMKEARRTRNHPDHIARLQP